MGPSKASDALAATPEMPEELAPRHIGARIVQLGAFGLLVVVAISALPGLGDLRAVEDERLLARIGELHAANYCAYG